MFIFTILYLMTTEKYHFIPVIMTIGVLQKESILFLSPVVFVHYMQTRGGVRKKSLFYFSLLLLFPTVTLFLTRSAIEVHNSYNAIGDLQGIFVYQVTNGTFWQNFIFEIFSGLGLLPLILLYRMGDGWKFLRNNLHWLVLTVLGIILLFCGADKARLFLYILPAVIVVTTKIIEPIVSPPRIHALLWITLSLILHYYLGYHFSPMDAYMEFFYRMIPVHASGPLLPNFIRIGVVLLIWIGLTACLRPFGHRTNTPYSPESS
jgi:hypothetical protein